MSNIKENFDDLFRDPANKGKIIPISDCIQQYNITHKDNKITEEIFYKEISEQNLNNEIRILFSKYDQYESVSLGDLNLQPESHEKRKKIYELLEIPDNVIKNIELYAPLPPKINIHRTVTTIAKDNREVKPWVDKVETDFYWWNKYKESLNQSLPEDVRDEVISSIDVSTSHILNYLHPPDKKEIYNTRGLVVGYVQSGKTSNMQALAAKAIDVGYKLVIILSGTNKILRAQTQRRFDKQILGKEIISPGTTFDDHYIVDPSQEYQGDDDFSDFISHGNNLQGRVKIKRLTTTLTANGLVRTKGVSPISLRENFPGQRLNSRENLNINDAYFAAIMKNTSGINRLTKMIKESGSNIEDIPILVIDDESDSASINVASRTSQNAEYRTISATNKAIRDLLKELPRAQYVAYTATPYANVFINPNNAEDIYPKDFITSLGAPPGYMGASDFEKKKYIRDIFVDGDNEDKAKLQEAIDAFVLSGAIKLYRVTNDGVSEQLAKHHTMLVHESSGNDPHEETARFIQTEIWGKNDYLGGAGLKRLKKLFEEDFLPHSKTLENEEPLAKNLPKNFDKLKPFILEAIDRIQSGGNVYKIVNQTEPDPDFSKENIWKVFVGGNKIARGYTIEGLTISYYTRPTTAGDTLQQMARWFGYRKNYKDLVRLYLGRNIGRRNNRDLYEEFQQIYNMDAELRRRIELFDDHKENAYEKDATPDNYGPLVRQFGDLLPTRRSAMQDVELQYDNLALQNKAKELYPKTSEKNRRSVPETRDTYFQQPTCTLSSGMPPPHSVSTPVR